MIEHRRRAGRPVSWSHWHITWGAIV